MKRILVVLFAILASGMLSRSCSAQYGFPPAWGMQGPMVQPAGYFTPPMSVPPMFSGGMAYTQSPPGYLNTPVMTASASPWVTTGFFQDGGVPFPSDADAAGAVVTPAPSPAMGSGDACCGVPLMTNPGVTGAFPWTVAQPVYQADPFLNQPMMGQQPTNIPPQGLFSYGASSPGPQRYGFQSRLDFSWLAASSLAGSATDKFESFGIDYELKWTSPTPNGGAFNWTNQFAYRNVDAGAGAYAVPDSLFRFGFDLELVSPSTAPAALRLAVTPSINTDFSGDTWGDGFQLDARGIMLFRMDDYWTLGLGAMYWDRLNDRVLPYAGLIYRSDYWEWQLMYPESRVSLFLGNEMYFAKWFYVRAEYHVEAYGIERMNGGVPEQTQVEFSDYRILGGFRMESSYFTWFLEGGVALDRKIEFGTTPAAGIDSGFIGQIGLRY